MSITAFFAVCILSIDFMIYFFFKLVYAEKHRAKPRRLPTQYYDDEFSAGCSESCPAQLVPARKNRLARAMNVLSMPTAKVKLPGSTERKQQQDDAASPRNSAELLAHRGIVSSHVRAGRDRKAS